MKAVSFGCSKRWISSSRVGSAVDEIVPLLQKILGDKSKVSQSKAILEQHSRDESYHRHGVTNAVVFPHSVDEVKAVVRLCNERKIPLIPFSTGTALEGGVNAPFGGVTLNLREINRILEVNPEDFDCTVETGVTRVQLNTYLRDTGLWFPVDPGADASLCGMCATSASGTNAVKYGTMKENVLNLQVVLPNGDVIWTRGENHRPRKTAAGYNLTSLFVGSEGTLGIITAATLKLYGVPDNVITAISSFPDVQSAVDTVVNVLQSGIPIARIEFLDEVQVEASNRYSHTNYPLTPLLFFEFQSGSANDAKQQAELVGSLCSDNKGTDYQWSVDLHEREILWKARHNAYYAALAMKPGCSGFITDVCVPISKLPGVVTQVKALIQKSSLLGPMVGHVGDGNFHCILLVDPQNEAEIDEAKKLSGQFVRLALNVGGTCTGEHGVGLGKRHYLREEVGETTYQLMKLIKRSIDPNNIMNPGKVI